MRQPTKKVTLRPEAPGAVSRWGTLPVPGHGGQGFKVPVGQKRRHEAGARGPQEVVHRFDENPLEFGAPGHDAVKPLRLAEEAPEDGFLDRRESHVPGQDGPGLDKNIQNFHAAGQLAAQEPHNRQRFR